MDDESKRIVAAAVRMVAEVALNPVERATINPALLAVAMGHVSDLLRVVKMQQAEIDLINQEADEASAIVRRLRAENDRLSAMLAGDLPV